MSRHLDKIRSVACGEHTGRLNLRLNSDNLRTVPELKMIEHTGRMNLRLNSDNLGTVSKDYLSSLKIIGVKLQIQPTCISLIY